MAAFLLDLLLRFVAWGAVAAGVAIVLHAVLSDQVIGLVRRAKVRRGLGAPRLRCPGGYRRLVFVPVRQGCWYDMTGIEAGQDGRVICPECGRRSRLRRLGRSKRRWRLALVGVCVILFGLVSLLARAIYRHGWKSVPDAVLVLVPFDERDWIENDLPNAHPLIKGMADEIAERDNRTALSPWASAHLGRRIQSCYERDADYGIDDASRAAFARLESTPFVTGIDRRPFSEAVATIAAAAGVPLTLDRAALEAAHIQPDRPIIVPAFTSMTCEMALDWACDRARAMQGWAVGEWTLNAGTVVVADDTSTDRAQHALVITAPPGQPGWAFFITHPLVATAPDRWRASGRTRELRHRADAAIATAPLADLLRFERLARIVASPVPFDEARAARIVAMRRKLESARITPLDADGTLHHLSHAIKSDAGVAVTIDPWGLNADQSLIELLVEQRPYSSTPSSHGDAFGDEPEVEPIELAWQALSTFQADAVHDETSIVVGLRASPLLSVASAYDISALKFPAGGQLLQRIFIYRDNNGYGHGTAFIVGNRVVIIGPPNFQAHIADDIPGFISDLTSLQPPP